MPPGTSCTPFTTGIMVCPPPHTRRGVGPADKHHHSPARPHFSGPIQVSEEEEVGQLQLSNQTNDDKNLNQTTEKGEDDIRNEKVMTL
jgi:hypothetical protein